MNKNVDGFMDNNEEQNQTLNEIDKNILDKYCNDGNIIVNHIHGDSYSPYAFGDGNIDFTFGNKGKSKYVERGGLHRRNLTQAEIIRIAKKFCEFKEFQDIKSNLYEKNFICIYDDVDTGKFAIAVKLLEELYYHDITHIHPIEEKCKIDLLDSIEIEKNIGYIVTGLCMGEINDFQKSALEKLMERAKEVDARIIIISDKNTIEGKNCLDIFYKCNIAENLLQVLHKNIEFLSKDEKEYDHIIKKIKDKGLEKYLKDSSQDIKGIEHAAGRIVSDSRIGNLNTRRLKEYFLEHIYENVKSWLRENRSLDNICFILALAVLNRSSLKKIEESAEHIKVKIKSQEDFEWEDNEKKRTIDEFLSDRLNQAKAEIFYRKVNKDGKDLEIKSVRFVDEQYAECVLNVVSKELYRLKPIVLESIREWGDTQDYWRMICLGRALKNMISEKNDYTQIYNSIILKWINQNGFYNRFLSSVSLNYISTKDRYIYEIKELLDRWLALEGKENYKFKWVATSMLGDNIGINFIGYALENLIHIYINEKEFLGRTALISIRKIFRYGKVERVYYDKVIFRLYREIQIAEKRETRKSILEIFMNLAVKEKAKNKKNEKEVSRLLCLIGSGEISEYIIGILIEGLKIPTMLKPLREVMNIWGEECEVDLRIKNNVEKLFLALEEKVDRNMLIRVNEIKKNFYGINKRGRK